MKCTIKKFRYTMTSTERILNIFVLLCGIALISNYIAYSYFEGNLEDSIFLRTDNRLSKWTFDDVSSFIKQILDRNDDKVVRNSTILSIESVMVWEDFIELRDIRKNSFVDILTELYIEDCMNNDDNQELSKVHFTNPLKMFSELSYVTNFSQQQTTPHQITFKNVLEKLADEIFQFHVSPNISVNDKGYGLSYWIEGSNSNDEFTYDRTMSLCSSHKESHGNEEFAFLCLQPDITTVTFLSDYGNPLVVYDTVQTDPQQQEGDRTDSAFPRAAFVAYPLQGKHVLFPGRLLRSLYTKDLTIDAFQEGDASFHSRTDDVNDDVDVDVRVVTHRNDVSPQSNAVASTVGEEKSKLSAVDATPSIAAIYGKIEANINISPEKQLNRGAAKVGNASDNFPSIQRGMSENADTLTTQRRLQQQHQRLRGHQPDEDAAAKPIAVEPSLPAASTADSSSVTMSPPPASVQETKHDIKASAASLAYLQPLIEKVDSYFQSGKLSSRSRHAGSSGGSGSNEIPMRVVVNIWLGFPSASAPVTARTSSRHGDASESTHGDEHEPSSMLTDALLLSAPAATLLSAGGLIENKLFTGRVGEGFMSRTLSLQAAATTATNQSTFAYTSTHSSLYIDYMQINTRGIQHPLSDMSSSAAVGALLSRLSSHTPGWTKPLPVEAIKSRMRRFQFDRVTKRLSADYDIGRLTEVDYSNKGSFLSKLNGRMSRISHYFKDKLLLKGKAVIASPTSVPSSALFSSSATHTAPSTKSSFYIHYTS